MREHAKPCFFAASCFDHLSTVYLTGELFQVTFFSSLMFTLGTNNLMK